LVEEGGVAVAVGGREIFLGLEGHCFCFCGVVMGWTLLRGSGTFIFRWKARLDSMFRWALSISGIW
jgi:hypothetical protein